VGDLSLATVRYLGPVDTQKGLWVGVEWDDTGRGKHDGIFKEKRYFECSRGLIEEIGADRKASFCRKEKLLVSMTFAQALRWRYSNEASAKDNGAKGDMYIQSKSGQRVNIELVGKDKVMSQQSKLGNLSAVYVPDACISSAGEEGKASFSFLNHVECRLNHV
jgi:dynactin complex subunit